MVFTLINLAKARLFITYVYKDDSGMFFIKYMDLWNGIKINHTIDFVLAKTNFKLHIV